MIARVISKSPWKLSGAVIAYGPSFANSTVSSASQAGCAADTAVVSLELVEELDFAGSVDSEPQAIKATNSKETIKTRALRSISTSMNNFSVVWLLHDRLYAKTLNAQVLL